MCVSTVEYHLPSIERIAPRAGNRVHFILITIVLLHLHCPYTFMLIYTKEEQANAENHLVESDLDTSKQVVPIQQIIFHTE